jgi:hypothetical protein
MNDLWSSEDGATWSAALERYDEVVTAQGVKHLPDLDRWYHEELPRSIRRRDPARVSHAELVRTTEWKMARGVWRGRNLALVRGNEPGAVEDASARAIAAIPDGRRPIAELVKLAGVGPATASAVAAAAAPHTYPFFDELVAAQVPGLGPVAFTLAYYLRYAEALRGKARALGGDWNPAHIERSLWANAGGKSGPR